MLRPLGIPGPNVSAGLRPLRENERMLDRTMQRLADGRLLAGAADDPAGLLAGLHIDAAIRALEAESRALQRRADVLAAKDGALAAATELTAELRALALRAASADTVPDAEKQALEIEAASIVLAIEHTTGAVTFGGEKLFNSTLTPALGETEGLDPSGEPATYTLADVGRSTGLFDDPALVEAVAEQATADLAAMRAEIGAEISSDIEPRSRATEAALVNLAKAHSLIVDTDYTRESAPLVRSEALANASRFLLALDRRNATLAHTLLGAA